MLRGRRDGRVHTARSHAHESCTSLPDEHMKSPRERPNSANSDFEYNAQTSAWDGQTLVAFARSELRKQHERGSDGERSNITAAAVSKILQSAKEIACARPADWLADSDPDNFKKLAKKIQIDRTELVPTEQKHRYIAEAIERQSLPRGHFHNTFLQSMVNDLLARAMSLANLPPTSTEDGKRVSQRARRVLRSAIRELDLETADPNQAFDVNDYRLQDIIQRAVTEAYRSHARTTLLRELDPAFEAVWYDAPPSVRIELTQAIGHRWFNPLILDASLSILEMKNSVASALVHRERVRHERRKGAPLERRHLFDDSITNQRSEFKASWDATSDERQRIVERFKRSTPNIDEKFIMVNVRNRLFRLCLLRDRLCLGPKELSRGTTHYITNSVRNACRDWYRIEKRLAQEVATDPSDLDDLLNRHHSHEGTVSDKLLGLADGVEVSISVIRTHALGLLAGCQDAASRALAKLCEDIALSVIDDDTRRVCELLLKLTLASVEVYSRWMQSEQEEQADEAVGLLQLSTKHKPRLQLKSLKLLVSAAYGEIDPDCWYRRYGDGLPRDKSNEKGAWEASEAADYRRFHNYIVGRRASTDRDTVPHPIIQKGVRGLLYEYLLEELFCQTKAAIRTHCQEEG